MMAEWIAHLGEAQVDAVLSTTALHWLAPEQLIRFYKQLGQVVRPGGVFLNGDNLRFGPHMPTFQRVAEAMKEHIREQAFNGPGLEDWESWWESFNKVVREVLLDDH